MAATDALVHAHAQHRNTQTPTHTQHNIHALLWRRCEWKVQVISKDTLEDLMSCPPKPYFNK